MLGAYIGMIILIVLFVEFWLIMYGIRMCKENNALGLILFFIGLNVLGLLIGLAILYNNKQKERD